MKSTEIRQAFIQYFQKHNHQYVASSSLIPENDPTILFANAGMNQFKNTFLGLDKRPYSRAVSVQKCVRAGGKHNDLDNVGFTARHHTFFEMLGNFSFGDYFKKEAIHFAWDFLTNTLKIPKEKLYITVFQTDDEAANIWHQQEGVPRDRIFRFGEKDNFWRMGDTGPCGPCTEIFYDHGPKAGLESDPFKGITSGEDRFVEIWNLVFMQFYEKAPGQMDPLPKPSVDTGSGLERVVAALQGKLNNYDTDLFRPMLEIASRKSKLNLSDLLEKESYFRDRKDISSADYKSNQQNLSALRVLADHCRSAGFLIADGALPSNEGRGYVLRRIIRRGIRFGRKLNPDLSILPAMVEGLVEHMGTIYPELQIQKNHILQTVQDEESRFLLTLDQGTHILQTEIDKIKNSSAKQVLAGSLVFKLYDTFGFPEDLTQLICQEQGIQIDQTGFQKEMEAAKTKAKASWKGKTQNADASHLITFAQNCFDKYGPTKFTGYEHFIEKGKVMALSDGKQPVTKLSTGEHGILVLDQSCFYAEGGGQVGDQGFASSENLKLRILNCEKKSEVFLHHIEVVSGTLQVGHNINLELEKNIRQQIMANHSATHLLHAALRKYLGSHVTQAGSLVDPNKLRFDFTHNKPLSKEDLQQIANLVNTQISLNLNVEVKNMSQQEAIKDGATALFGEKYGDMVRVLKMGDFSCELCGGTHVSNTAQIRLFKIISESGVSSGVRRVEAIAGECAANYALQSLSVLEQAYDSTGVPNDILTTNENTNTKKSDLIKWIEDKKELIKNLEREIKKLKGSGINLDEIISKAQNIHHAKFGDFKLIAQQVELEDREVLAQINDQIKNKIGRGICILLGRGESGFPLLVGVTKDLIPNLKAGDILKSLAQHMDAKGGGRPDFAQGAANKPESFQQAIEGLIRDWHS